MRKTMLALCLLVAYVVALPSAASVKLPEEGDILIYHPSGAVLSIPAESWDVTAYPKGFNTGAYHATLNPKGKLPGWQGWPEYLGDCDKTIDFSPRICHRQPFFMSAPVEQSSE